MAELALASRTQIGVTLSRFEVGRRAIIGSCESCRESFPAKVMNRQHRITWCYRSADGGTEDIICLVEVPAEELDGCATPRDDQYARFMVPIGAIHEDDRDGIVSYAFRNRQGFVVGSKPIEAPRKKRRAKADQPEEQA